MFASNKSSSASRYAANQSRAASKYASDTSWSEKSVYGNNMFTGIAGWLGENLLNVFGSTARK